MTKTDESWQSESCEDCVFAKFGEVPLSGTPRLYCRRFPPQPCGVDALCIYPIVNGLLACAEFRGLSYPTDEERQ